MMNFASRMRRTMLLATVAGAALALPSGAHAQLVSNGDLVNAQDSAGNPGRVTVSNPTATTATINVLAPVVIANWTRFNVPTNTTLTVTNASAAAQAALLNRVIGGSFSDIGGTINANGVNLWLLNQNGILFGSNTNVNASSFFASTLGVTDADFFDFYEGSNLAGNSSGTINLSGPGASTAAIVAPTGARFTTDGTLFFAGPALDVTGTFNAQSGAAAFIAATNLSVSFSNGSPVSYSIASGTTVAQQQIGGSVAGKQADFVLLSSSGVVNALLTVNANVATTAAAGTNGIILYGASLSSPGSSIVANGTLNSTGLIIASADQNVSLNQAVSGGSFLGAAGGTFSSRNVSATAGNLEVSATSVSGRAFKATNNVSVDASNGIILEAAAANSDGVGGGSLAIGAGNVPSSLTILNSASGATVNLQATGNIDLGSVTSGAGVVAVSSAAGNITANFVSASGGNAQMTAAGRITTGSISASNQVVASSAGGGALSLGNVTGGSVDLDTAGGLLATNIIANAGGIDIDVGGMTANALIATGGLTIDAPGTITLNAAVADSDGVGGGDLAIGTTTRPSALTVSNSASGAAVNLRATGPVSVGVVNSRSGNTVIDAAGSAISANAVIASGQASLTAGTTVTTTGGVKGASVNVVGGGNVALGSAEGTAGPVDVKATSGSITTGAVKTSNGIVVLTARDDVTTNGPVQSSSAIYIESTGGGDLNLGPALSNPANPALLAGGGIKLDTTGTITAGAVTAGGKVTVGEKRQPASVTFTGPVSSSDAN